MQKLCTKYGYRLSTKHSALVDIAVDCWKALNPEPNLAGDPISPLATAKRRAPSKTASTSLRAAPAAGMTVGGSSSKPKPKPKVRPKPTARAKDKARDMDIDEDYEDAALEYAAMMEAEDSEGAESDISSADVPLARAQNKGKGEGKAKNKPPAKPMPTSITGKAGKAASQVRTAAKYDASDLESITSHPSASGTGTGTGTESGVEHEPDSRPMEVRFREMVVSDPELYLRILYYEPIHFDEFVSRAIRAGLKDRRDKGWKIALKKFLDFEVGFQCSRRLLSGKHWRWRVYRWRRVVC